MSLVDEKLAHYRRKREVAECQLQYIDEKIQEIEQFKEGVEK